MQAYIKKMSKYGYEVISQSPEGVQLKRPKRWSRLLLLLGLVSLPLFGIGAGILGLAVLDYIIKREHSLYVTAVEIKEGGAPGRRPIMSTPIIVGLSFLAAFVGLIFLFISF